MQSLGKWKGKMPRDCILKKKKIKAKNMLFENKELQHKLGKYSLHNLEDSWLRILENGDSYFYQMPKQVFLSSFKILNA